MIINFNYKENSHNNKANDSARTYAIEELNYSYYFIHLHIIVYIISYNVKPLSLIDTVYGKYLYRTF